MDINFSLSIELQCFIRDHQKRISSASNVEEIQETLSLIQKVFSHGVLPGRFSSPNDKQFLKEDFVKNHFVRFADLLLREPAIDFLANLDDEHKNKLDYLFSQGPASECFIVLTGALSHSTKTGHIKTVVSLLEGFVKDKRFVDVFVLKSEKHNQEGKNLSCIDTDLKLKQSNLNEKQLVTLIVSLPERIANKLRLKMNSVFYPETFFVKIAEQILEAMEALHSNVAANLMDVSFIFLSDLFGRMCMAGHGKKVLGVLLPSFEEWTSTSPLWCCICQRLMAAIPDHVLEPVIENLLKEANNPGIIGKLLGDSILTNSRLSFLLTTKFLLLRYYSDIRIVINIIGYLSGCKRRHLLIKALSVLFDSWSNNSAIIHTPYNQHVYISCCIVHITGYLSNDEGQTNKHDLLKKLLVGVQNHLESPEQKVRRLGMIVAECVTAVLEPNTERLSFEYEDDDESKLLKDLSKGMKAEIMQKSYSLKSNKTENLLEKSPAQGIKEHTTKESVNEEGDNDDDDLKPYDIEEEDSEDQRPLHHLRDCMEALLDSKNMDKFESALKSVERIVCALPGDLDEVCVELIKILLHLQDHFSTDNFIELRLRAMVAITARCPVPVAKFFTEEFYAANYSIIQRLDILDVLASSAQQLSQPVEIQQEKIGSKKFLPSVYNNQMNVESIPEWQRVVQERIEKKTKRFTKGPSKEKPNPVANKFSQVAGHFFYPLMANYDHKQNTLDLLGEDSFVLSRLIYTLGVIVHSARGTPVVLNMGSALIEFTWALRYHHEPVVRQVLVFALVMVFTSVPITLLFNDHGEEMFEVHNWLKDLMEKDSNVDVKRTAIQALMVLEDASKKEVMPEGN